MIFCNKNDEWFQVDEQSNLVIIGQNIYIDYLIDNISNYPSELELDELVDIGSKRNEYAGFTRTVYYMITGIRLDKPSLTWDNSSRLTSLVEQEDDVSPIKIYPNPVSHILTIENNSEKMFQYEILNLDRQIIRTKGNNYNKAQVNISDLNAGIYIIKVVTKNGEMITKKIIKL